MARLIDDFVGIGPYIAGEVPFAHTHRFDYADGTPIVWNAAAHEAAFQFRRLGDTSETAQKGGPCTFNDQSTIESGQGQVTYQWELDDLDAPGMYVGEMWVGLGDGFLIASALFRWIVTAPAYTAPADLGLSS